MATIKITALGHLSNADIAPGDVFVIDDVSATTTKKLTAANLTSYISTTLGNLQTYASYANSTISNLSLSIGDTTQLVTADKSNLVAAINEVASNTTLNTIVFGSYTISERVTNNVSSLGADVFSMPRSTKHFAKLLINVEDLTYGQYQTSELLLVHDSSDSKVTEYGIVFTSTNPIVAYDTYFDANNNVVLRAVTTSADNIIRVLQITS
jgi:hypothetical protein